MADVKKMATREGYGRGLVALGAAHEDIVVLDADLAGSTKTGMFAKAYPDRHFNCGIAEADMMCVAAGFAANGFVPFAPVRGRGRREPPVLRGLCPHALHPRHGRHLPRRRRGG